MVRITLKPLFILICGLQILTVAGCSGLDALILKSFGPAAFHDEMLSLKDVHLDGSALLNKDVFVGGKLEVVGAFGTFVVISEERVRMLVDLSRLAGAWEASSVKVGQTIHVLGKVQSGEKGHFYLVANAIRAG